MIRYHLQNPDHDLQRATEGASGYDLQADEGLVLRAGERRLVSTGLRTAFPPGVEGQIRSRSGLANKSGVIVLNAPGTIDADYRGEVKVNLMNHGDADLTIAVGDRIAQLVFAPVLPDWASLYEDKLPYEQRTLWIPTRVERVEDLGTTERGEGGFGSTGVR